MTENDQILDWLTNKLERYQKFYKTVQDKGMLEMGKIRMETIESLIEGRRDELRRAKS